MLNETSDSKPNTNVADAPPESNRRQPYTDIRRITDDTESSDVTSILAYDLNIMDAHPEANGAVAEDLMVLSQA